MIITIDGYSNLRKSTIGKKLAEHMNFEFFSTGILVRSVAKEFAKMHGLSEDKAIENAIKCTEKLDIDKIIIESYYSKEVEESLSIIAKYPWVNDRLKPILIKYVSNKNIILDGRFTFLIFPNAQRKFYFKSGKEKRAKLRAYAKSITLDEAKKYISYRDSFEIETIIPEDVCILDPFDYNDEELIQYMKEKI